MNETLEKHPLLKELEINNEVEISVEQRHIDQGQKNVRNCLPHSTSCAIYLAIEEYFGRVSHVAGSINFYNGPAVKLPREADIFIGKHDALVPVQPFKFKIKL